LELDVAGMEMESQRRGIALLEGCRNLVLVERIETVVEGDWDALFWCCFRVACGARSPFLELVSGRMGLVEYGKHDQERR
jgi:hypothetical protein